MRKILAVGLAMGVVAVIATIFLVGRMSATADPLLIGHVAPLTGDEAIFGVWEREGIDLAVDEVNAAGGVSGRPLTVRHEDDQGVPSMAVSAIQSLISARGARIVIGGTLSGTTLAMAPVAMRNKVVLLSPSAQSPKISEAGDFIFRIFASTTVEGSYIADVAMRSGIQSAAILYLNNDYGVGLRNTIKEKIAGRVRLLAEEAYGGDTRDFRTHIQKVVGSSIPDGLFLLGYQADIATILKQMSEMGIKTRVFAPNSFEGDETVKIAGKAAEGVVYVYPVLSDTQMVERVRAAYRSRFGRDMNVYNGVGYDAVKLLAFSATDALKVSGKPDSEALRDALHRVRDFPGVTGPITFGKNGDVLDRPMEVRVYRNGRFVKQD